MNDKLTEENTFYSLYKENESEDKKIKKIIKSCRERKCRLQSKKKDLSSKMVKFHLNPTKTEEIKAQKKNYIELNLAEINRLYYLMMEIFLKSKFLNEE